MFYSQYSLSEWNFGYFTTSKRKLDKNSLKFKPKSPWETFYEDIFFFIKIWLRKKKYFSTEKKLRKILS